MKCKHAVKGYKWDLFVNLLWYCGFVTETVMQYGKAENNFRLSIIKIACNQGIQARFT